MSDLTVTLIQSNLAWEDIPANLAMFDAKIDEIQIPTDLILLPEMFSTGFSMEATRIAETMDGAAVTWMRRKAATKCADLAGSLVIKENGQFFNRLIWAQPNGHLMVYDKKHLFRYAGEDKVYTAGHKRVTVKLNGWRICPFICYDLRFPIWTRNLNQAYDLALFAANWPQSRIAHWQVLLQARAIENQAYVIGVNRTGVDGRGYVYSGNSVIFDPMGKAVFQANTQECIHTARLQFETLKSYRQNFPAWQDADMDLADITINSALMD